MTTPSDAVDRLRRLADPGSLEAVESVEEVVAARGRLRGVPTRLFATDPAARGGGALSATGTRAIARLYDGALDDRVPVVGVWHSGGARVDQGVASLDAVGELFARMTRASGRIPQISLVAGPAAGGAAYGPGLSDLVVMAPEARVFVTGPGVIEEVTGERVTMTDLGGPGTHGSQSGVAHVAASSLDDACARAADLVHLLAEPGTISVERVPAPDPARHLPASVRRAYDIRPIVDDLLDAGSGQELQAGWAPNIVTTLGRWQGRAVGVVANNPIRMAGCLDALAAEKAARFVRMCDAFGVPLVALVDVPGFLPGLREETGGVVRRGAKLLHAFAGCVVPRVTVVVHKAYGGAYIAMNSRSLGASRVLAWPGAQIGVMGAPAAVGLLHRRALEAEPPERRAALRERLARQYARDATHVTHARELGLVDEIIAPAATRAAVAAALLAADSAATGRHDNIPL